MDPYRGKPGPPGYLPTPPATAAIAAWAALDGCRTAVTTRVAPHIAVITYPCGAQLVTVNGGGHTWPGGAPVNPSLGVTTVAYPGDYDTGRVGAIGGSQLRNQCGQEPHIAIVGSSGEVPGWHVACTLWQHRKHAGRHRAGRNPAQCG